MQFDQNTIVLAGGGSLIFLIFLLIARRPKNKTQKLPYIQKTDPNAQDDYKKHLSLDQKPLTKDEKIELSWQFLYDITDIVLNKFSKEDKKNVHSIGHQMIDGGTGYEHVVEYGIKKAKKTSRAMEENDQSIAQERKI